MESHRTYSWEHPKHVQTRDAVPSRHNSVSSSSWDQRQHRRTPTVYISDDDEAGAGRRYAKYPPLFCQNSSRCSPMCSQPCSRSHSPNTTSRQCSSSELGCGLCNTYPSSCCSATSHSCSQHKPLRIIIPAKKRDFFEELKRSSFFNLFGNLLTLVVIYLFIMSMIEHILYHEVGDHNQGIPEEEEA
ncbi:hypothetical protein Btru_024002 [Bulinus truncatus]|nr:hypothetical protein Btru_024002 [Bulinus truncatus]